MRWRGEQNTRWRLRQDRLAWRARVKLGIIDELTPGGLGTDPISFVLALPALLVAAVLVPFWLVEFALRLLLAPVAAVLRATGVVPYRLDVLRNGTVVATHTPVGRRRRREVRAAASRTGRSSLAAN